MIRTHLNHIKRTVDEQPISSVIITVAAILSLPLLGTGVRTVGSTLNLGWMTLPLLAVAHVPVVIALISVWSIGCDVCR